MWAKLLICSTLCVPLVHAEDTSQPKPRSLFSYTQAQSLVGQVRCLYDIVVLKDGTQLTGTVQQLPPLTYSFGPLNLDASQVRLLSPDTETPNRVNIWTADNHHYIGTVNQGTVDFVEEFAIGGKPLESQAHPLDMNEVLLILLKPRNQTSPKKPPAPFQLTLANGDEIPVQILQRTIPTNDGWSRIELKTDELHDISFSGGLFGTLKDTRGRETTLPLTFAVDPHLTILPIGSQQTVKLPWPHVANIRRNPARADPTLCDDASRAPDLFATAEFPSTTDNEFRAMESREPDSTEDPPEELELPEELDVPEELDIPEVESPDEQVVPDDLGIPDELDVPGVESPQESDPFPSTIEVDEPEITLALGEDFDLSEWEKQKEDQTAEPTDSEEFDFISQQPQLQSQEIAILQQLPQNHGGEVTERAPDNVVSAMQGVYDGMVYIAGQDLHTPGFFVKARRVTNKEYAKFVESVHYKTPSHWIMGSIPPDLEDKPVVNISYKDALLYAVWANKRLPTEAELRRAAEESQVALGLEDNLYEWTATPSPIKALNTEAQAKRMGREPRNSHEVYSLKEVSSLRNDEPNSYTGFRVVAGGFR